MPDIGIEKVKVSGLDEMARMAFQGTKSLNLIQYIVYNQAYHTNENFLICAPTGAGKTNIAMLTVLRELKFHLTPEGNIKKNEFKVKQPPLGGLHTCFSCITNFAMVHSTYAVVTLKMVVMKTVYLRIILYTHMHAHTHTVYKWASIKKFMIEEIG